MNATQTPEFYAHLEHHDLIEELEDFDAENLSY